MLIEPCRKWSFKQCVLIFKLKEDRNKCCSAELFSSLVWYLAWWPQPAAKFTTWKSGQDHLVFIIIIYWYHRLAAGDHTVGPAVPRRHIRGEVVPLQVIIRPQHGLQGGASVGVHSSPLGSGVLEPNLEIQSFNKIFFFSRGQRLQCSG